MNLFKPFSQKQSLTNNFAQQSFVCVKENVILLLRKNGLSTESGNNKDITVLFNQKKNVRVKVTVGKNNIFIGLASYTNSAIETVSTSIFFKNNNLFVYKNTDNNYIHSALQASDDYISGNSQQSKHIISLEITTPNQLTALLKEIEELFKK